MFGKLKKFTFLTIVALVVFTSVGGAFLAPAPANAQLATVILEDIPQKVGQIAEFIKKAVTTGFKIATVNTVTFVLQKAAYDSAVFIASGGKGQDALAWRQNFGSYIKDVGDQAAGSFIQDLGGDKLNLCHIPDIKIDLAMKIGLRTNFVGVGAGGAAPKKPDCSLSELAANWGKEYNSKYGAQSTVKRFNAIMQVDNSSDLGIQIQTTQKLAEKVYQENLAATLQREEGKGFKAKETPISGHIQTPPSLIEEQAKAQTPDKAAKEKADDTKASLNSDDPGVWSVALSIFLNTLVSEGVKNWQTKGILPIPGLNPDDPSTAATAVPTGGIQRARDFNRALLTVKIGEASDYDVLSQLVACPGAVGTYNCRANADLITAVNQADAGEPMTIGEALQKNLLHGDYSLIPPSSSKNSDKDCSKTAYCHGNLQVLRQLRILPLGFEIAAKHSNPDRPWTLREVVKGFDSCDFVNPDDHSKGIKDDPEGHPFCRLIDPNWVLKMPLARCAVKGPGPVLLGSGLPNRLEDCMDVQTCVNFAADGVTCADYGYCSREQSVWKFPANSSCPAQATTCKTLTNQDTKQPVSYLYRTLDTGFCSDKNVGCTAYSLSQDSAGKWQTPAAPNAALNFINTGIYFNSNVSACSANSAGCSAFLASDASLLYLRKAPDYLNCYDSDLRAAAPGVQWPQTVADLNRLKPKTACTNYAKACIADEVSCSLYTPVIAGEQSIPGRYAATDVCDKTCVGYAAYREMPTTYSSGQAVAYVIPSTLGAGCSKADENCTGFTNLSTTAGGLEQVDYFSELRACVTPEKDKGKIFITYEGSQKTGFQIQTYILAESTDGSQGGSDNIGAPKYFYKDQAELNDNLVKCNATTYKAGTGGEHCRQFNDEQGRTYYRLLSKTIPVTSACTPFRLNNPELTPGGSCFQNGEYRDGNCFYYGLPSGAVNSAGSSVGCSAAVDTCRAYKGNAGGIAGQIFNDNFESKATTTQGLVALSGWSANTVSQSLESTRQGEHSLQIVGSASKTVALLVDTEFDVTFWAKGVPGTITVQLKRAGTASPVQTLGVVGVGDTWNYYRLGSKSVDGSEVNGGSLIFMVSGGGTAWLDNVILNHSTDVQYLIKKKLTVPTECDSDPNDNLPGVALGCTAYTYKNAQNKDTEIDLTNFSHLCRAEAIGCTAVIDTQNTVAVDSRGQYKPGDESSRAYNVWLSGSPGTTAQLTLDTDVYSCAVPVGESGCYLSEPIINHAAAAIQAVRPDSFVASTVFIPQDTPVANPIYLVNDPTATCGATDLGCTMAGKEKITPTGVTFVTTTIKNDPLNTYKDALCEQQAVGCQKYADTSGGSYFFKDPAAIGQKICTYKTDVAVGGVKTSGWFWKGVGACSTDTAIKCQKNTEVDDCGAGNTCGSIDNQPCYPDYIQNGDTYGLWSYGNTGKYKNYVGQCESAQDKCTEFVDHVKIDSADPSKSINQAYYLINDPSKLNQGDCADGVSQQAGCALFDQTDNPNKYWSRDLSYAASDAQDGKKVAAVDSTDAARPNDTNVIFKVIRDRGCGEWLSCSYVRTVFDSAVGLKDTCENIQRCDKTGCGATIDSAYTDSVFTEALYRERSVGWNGDQFSGYSILGLYPVEELEDVNFATGTGNPDYRLVKKVLCGSNNCTVGTVCTNDDAACGTGGFCINHTCVRAITGAPVAPAEYIKQKQTCRSYPEADSPFPAIDFGLSKQGYARANTCAEGRTDGSAYLCDCDYTKVVFGQVTKYWNYNQPNVGGIKDAVEDAADVFGTNDLEGVCVGGLKGQRGAEQACSQTSECGNGFCEPKSSEIKVIGLKGYCLEYDNSRNLYGDPNKHPCLTWYPGKLNGVPDIYNQYIDAGFNMSNYGYRQGPFYCTKQEVWQKVATARNLSVSGYVDCDGELGEGSNGTWLKDDVNQNPRNVVDVMNKITGITDFSFGVKCINAKDNSGALALCKNGSAYLYSCVVGFDVDNPCPYIPSKVPTCLTGGHLGLMKNLSASLATGCGENEDLVNFTYECISDQLHWEKKIGWYPDIEHYTLAGNEEFRCSEMVQIAAEPQEIVALTQTMWTITKNLALPSRECLAGSTSLSTFSSDPFGIKIGSDPSCAVGDVVLAQSSPAVRPQMFVAAATKAIPDLRKLFAVAEIYYNNYNGSTFQPKSSPLNPLEIWNETETGYLSSLPYPPKVLSVGNCQFLGGKELCPEGPPGLTIFANQRYYTGGPVRLNPGATTVNMRFFAYAANEQMPIRSLSVQWGDNTSDDRPPNTSAYYHNLRGARDGKCVPSSTNSKTCVIPSLFPPSPPSAADSGDLVTNKTCTTDNDCKALELCQPKTADSKFYGLLENETCNTGYFQFKNHVYTCNSATLPAACSDTVTTNCYQATCTADRALSSCCVFTPRVQVKDNWGWCNGSCANTTGAAGISHPNGGCYDRSWTGTTNDSNECGLVNGPWTNFGGKIIVAP